MAFTPDVIVTTDNSPATIALVAEAKGATANIEEAGLQLKEYMLQMGCPVGIIFTPHVLRIYKYRFLGRTPDPIDLRMGDFPRYQDCRGILSLNRFDFASAVTKESAFKPHS